MAGCGIRLAGHLTAETEHLIKTADRIYAHAGDRLALAAIEDLGVKVEPLDVHYAPGRCRDHSYEAMVETVLEPVRNGEQVCAVFYGHPGVFVWPAHEAIRRARAAGFPATMYPGISAEDCLFADLGLDPAVHGCQSYEAGDFLLYARRIDPTAALILWQPAALGDRSRSSFETDPAWVRVLAEVLMDDYPADHPVVIYEAAAFPLDRPRRDTIALERLHQAEFSPVSTLYLEPVAAPSISEERLARLGVAAEDIVPAAFQRYRSSSGPCG